MRSPSIIRFLLLFLIGIFIFLFFYIGLYIPQKQNLALLKSDLASSEKNLLSLKKKKSEFLRRLQQSETMVDIPEDVLRQFPQSIDIPKLLSSWTQKGKALGIEFLLFEPLKEQPVGPLIEMPIQITLRGTFQQTLQFLNYLKSLEKKVFITNVEMTRPQIREDLYVISTNSQAMTYRQGALQK